MRTFVVMAGVILALGVAATGATSWVVTVAHGDRSVEVDLPLTEASVGGTVAYQGPVMTPGDENWKSARSYTGIPLTALLANVGGMSEGDVLSVIAGDGYEKKLPYAAIYGETPAGTAILGIEVGSDGDDAPILAFLPPDGQFSNDDMLAALGEEYAHYFGQAPSTTGLLVKGVAYLIVNYDGGDRPTASEEAAVAAGPAEGTVLTVVRGGETFAYTMADLEMLESLTAPGTFTNSAGVDYSATYTGIPFSALIGDAPADATVRVYAADGYSMNYPASQLMDSTEGTWVVAYQVNGWYMPLDPGYLRIVQIGDANPHFTSSLSARMVKRIEVLGEYTSYALTLVGETTRTFSRGELEAGIGCPCHTATVTVTSKGETATYSGLPLWRLLAYVDGGTAPADDEGIHYNDEDFDATRAGAGYTITLQAEDGYAQTVSSAVVAGDDRFLVAFKKNGAFLDASSDGAMRFVFDDSVVLPEGKSLKSVKFLTTILLTLE
ncbi:MAG: hypothetical protein AB1778_00890 [Candidatus Bipolaricaulota bacterium]